MNHKLKKQRTRAMLVAVALGASAAAVAQSYPDKDFALWPSYGGDDLELTIDNKGTHFTLWSPQADEVRVLLYDAGANTAAYDSLAMERSDNGTWRATVAEDLKGKFYTFRVKHHGSWLKETPGVWAKAVGVNGYRAAIIDLKDTNPVGWSEDKGPRIEHITDAVIYEMHHRDFSVHPTSGIANKGKFLALTEPATHSPLGDKTGIEHLKELGSRMCISCRHTTTILWMRLICLPISIIGVMTLIIIMCLKGLTRPIRQIPRHVSTR
jgi:pullulanase